MAWWSTHSQTHLISSQSEGSIPAGVPAVKHYVVNALAGYNTARKITQQEFSCSTVPLTSYSKNISSANSVSMLYFSLIFIDYLNIMSYRNLYCTKSIEYMII